MNTGGKSQGDSLSQIVARRRGGGLKSGCGRSHFWPSAFLWKRALSCVALISLSVVGLRAQTTKYSEGFGASGRPPVTIIPNATFERNPGSDEERCFPWKSSAARPPAVSVTTWKVPSRARDEFEKACDASQKNQFTEAERHARGAIRKFQNYSAAWVMLGIILEEQNKSTDALDSCAHGAIIDAKYLPAYLCTAEISVRHHDWGHVLNSANLALRLKTTGDPYRYYYRAMAYLHMDDPEEAKKDALQAMDLDLNHEEPSFYLLMAEIYEREGDHPNALAQLRQFLKHPTDPHHERVARQLLANIESQQNIQ